MTDRELNVYIKPPYHDPESRNIISDTGIKMVAAYCFALRELSISDCPAVTDTALTELARLGPRLRYLSAAKCVNITDRGVIAVAR